MIHVVTGPPCAGKTTFVHENRNADDVVIDLDSIASALGSENRYEYSRPIRQAAFAARDAAIASVSEGDAWVIHSSPTEEQRRGYGDVEFHDLDPGLDECLARAKRDGRPPWTESVIRDYYRNQASHGALFSCPDGGDVTHRARGIAHAEHRLGAGKGAEMSESTTTSQEGTPTAQAEGTTAAAQADAGAENRSAEGSQQFTQDEFNRLVAREKRALREKYADYDALKEKAAQLDALEEAKKSELEKAQDATAKAVDEANGWKAKYDELAAEVERRKAIDKAALEYKVDAAMLARMSGDVEDNARFLAEQASSAPKYPSVSDGGETKPQGRTLDEIRSIKDPVQRVRARAEYESTLHK